MKHVLTAMMIIILLSLQCRAQDIDSLKQAILNINPSYKVELQNYKQEQAAGKVFQVIGILGMSLTAVTYTRQFDGESLPMRLLLSSSGVLLIGTAIRIQSGVKLRRVTNDLFAGPFPGNTKYEQRN